MPFEVDMRLNGSEMDHNDTHEHVTMFIGVHNADGTLHEGADICSCQLDGITISDAPPHSYTVVLPIPQQFH